MKQWDFRGARRAGLGVLATLSALIVPMAGASAAVPAVPLNSLVRTGQNLPNYFYDPSVPASDQAGSNATVLIADTVNHLVIEFQGGSGYYHNGKQSDCITPLAEVDADTYGTLVSPSPATCNVNIQGSAGNGKAPVNAIDSRDRLLFVAAATYPNPGVVLALSEKTLTVVGRWPMPTSAPPKILGMSWDEATNSLVVMTSAATGLLATPTGATVTSINIAASLAASTTVANWSVSVPGCASALNNSLYEMGAHASQSRHEVYVPCTLTGSAPSANSGIYKSDHEGVVAVQLGKVGCTAPATECPSLDASGNPVTVSAVAPTQAVGDFIFDAQRDRGFMPQQEQSGINVFVYDGAQHAFTSRFSVGVPADANAITFAFDQASGRLYSFGPTSGVTLVDGRRTPPTASRQFPQVSGRAEYELLPVLPPDAMFPYTRALVNYYVGDPSNSCTACRIPYFTVIADTVSVTSDPPVPAVDQNTQQLTPGDRYGTKFGASARGYGVHSDFFGGLEGAINNVSAGSGPPFQPPVGGGNQDLLMAEVGKLGGSDGSIQATAAGVSDAANNTTADYEAHSNGQPWPYPAASCSFPGGKGSDSVSGFYTSSGPEGGDNVASASAHCAGAQATPATGWEGESMPASAAWATAHFQGYRQTSAGLPATGFGPSSTYAYTAPPTAGGGAVAYSRAASEGITLDIGPGAQLRIGSVVQWGKATAAGATGSAHAERTVLVSDVSVTNNGVAQQLCTGPCQDNLNKVIESINSEFPTLIQVSHPAPEEFFFKGSPGGYEAAVQASVEQQLGDQRFNGMGAEEATYLPALRIVVYKDSDYQPNREVIDLAGIQVDAELGHEKLIDPAFSGPLDLQSERLAAGVPSTSTFVADPAATANGGAANTGGIGGQTNGITGLVQRAFNGFKWLFRSPGEVLQMLGLMALLLSPFMVMDRRRLWIRDVFGRRSAEPAGPLDLVIRS